MSTATILRVDGDTGTLTGSFRDGRFVLSHFSGARPLLLEVTPAADGTLTLRAERADRARRRAAKARATAAIGAPTDPAQHTTREGSVRAVPLQLPRPRRARS